MKAESYVSCREDPSPWRWRIGAEELARALPRLTTEDALSLPLMRAQETAALVAEAPRLEWRTAKPIVGEGERRVWQDFQLTMRFPEDSPYRDFAGAVQKLLHGALALMDEPPMPPVPLNDMILQDYPVGSVGITPHRDHVRYRYLVAIVVLRGAGRFFVCTDRSGRDAREVPAPAGALLLMRAPGFAGMETRPFHLLREVTAKRLAFGLRYDSRANDGTV